MCGLFGFFGPGPVKSVELRRCALAARRRGPDSIGAWIVGEKLEGELIVGVGGSCDSTLERIVETAVARRASRIVGHCRLSPDASWRDPRNAQPLIFPFGALAHNGNVPHHHALAERWRLELRSAVDSEIVGRLVESGHAEDLPSAFALVDSGAPVAWLALQGQTLFALRRGHPLNLSKRAEGFYIASDPRCGEPLEVARWHVFRDVTPVNREPKPVG